ncbi:cytochrome P450 [Micromonospora arborensis]|uniref:cytochrome P450 n=1 Tax=Micromonospora arborensis TaxID=2116518 RepID=UPI0033D04234
MRTGMMWSAMQRLEGSDGMGADGPGWRLSRSLIQPLFTAKAIGALVPGMVDAINEAVDNIAERTRSAPTVDLAEEMMRITHRVLGRVFLGDRISAEEADAVGSGIATAFGSMQSRLALPFVSHRIPLPGDRTFNRATQAVDAILLPHIEHARKTAEDAVKRAALQAASNGASHVNDEPERTDLVWTLAHATDEQGKPLDVRKVRDDVVALFTAGTETTSLTLTWTFAMLDSRPDIRAKVTAEVDRVVGDGPVTGAHVKELTYTRMVLEESLRMYPPAWMIPRTLQAPDELAGVPLPAGTTVILSPYMTHRMPHLWDEPEQFDPERFADGAQRDRHPYAFFPFGGGVHRCLGSHFFSIEATLATAALVSRFRMRLRSSEPIRPTVSVSLRPKGKILMEVTPHLRGSTMDA